MRTTTKNIAVPLLSAVFLVLVYTNCGKQDAASDDLSKLNTVDTDTHFVGKDDDICEDLYEPYPNALPLDQTRLNKVVSPVRAGSYTFIFSINTVDLKTSDKDQLLAQNLPNDHYQASMYVNVSHAFGENKVDLVLGSREPTLWILRGNVAAVRKVIIRGIRCSTVVSEKGGKTVANKNISIMTNDFEFNPIPNPVLFDTEGEEQLNQGTELGRVFIAR